MFTLENKEYAIASVQPDINNNWTRLVYYTGEESFHGGSIWGNVKDAKFFTQEELLDFMKSDKNSWYLGCVIVHIADCTKQKILENKDLERKYNSVACIR